MTLSSPTLKKAIKAAKDMGLKVVSFEIGQGGEIRVMTAGESKNDADTALDNWKKLHGKGS